MRFFIAIALTGFLAASCGSQKQEQNSSQETDSQTSFEKQDIYQFKVEDIEGLEFDFNIYSYF